MIGSNYKGELKKFVDGEKALGRNRVMITATALGTGSRARFAMWNGNNTKLGNLPNTSAVNKLRGTISDMIKSLY